MSSSSIDVLDAALMSAGVSPVNDDPNGGGMGMSSTLRPVSSTSALAALSTSTPSRATRHHQILMSTASLSGEMTRLSLPNLDPVDLEEANSMAMSSLVYPAAAAFTKRGQQQNGIGSRPSSAGPPQPPAFLEGRNSAPEIVLAARSSTPSQVYAAALIFKVRK